MGNAKKKYYAVRIGRKPGIYDTWDECNDNVYGYSGAVYKSFFSLEEARAFLNPAQKKNAKKHHCVVEAYVDGSYVDGRAGWGYLLLRNGFGLVKGYGPCTKARDIRNIGGEIESAERAVMKAVEYGADLVRIYHDYEGIGRWGNREWSRNKPDTKAYADFIAEMRKKIDIEFVKVKGHTGVVFNEMADRLAAKGVTATEVVEQLLDAWKDTFPDDDEEKAEMEDMESKMVEEVVESGEEFKDVLPEGPENANTLAPGPEGVDKSSEEISAEPAPAALVPECAPCKYSSLAEFIKAWRKAQGLTQYEMGVRLNANCMKSYERGEQVAVSAEKLREIYNAMAPDDLSFAQFVLLWADALPAAVPEEKPDVFSPNPSDASTPECFVPEEDNPYPLCVGGKEKCKDCCVYAHYEEHHDPYATPALTSEEDAHGNLTEGEEPDASVDDWDAWCSQNADMLYELEFSAENGEITEDILKDACEANGLALPADAGKCLAAVKDFLSD